MGTAQHRLGGLAHDALHHLMFKNRYLNELISDWFCMFPIYSLTYIFRLEHLGHHQQVNDPEKDPDILLLKEGGYYFEVPSKRNKFSKAPGSSVYPIQIYAPLQNPNVADQVLGFRPRLVPPLFGTPTSLRVGAEMSGPGGAIYVANRAWSLTKPATERFGTRRGI